MECDLAVVGGGIIGVATAREALRRFPRASLVLLEKEADLALHQSGRNSGVIHSGIYYSPGSLKAATCVEGGAAMVAFCRQQGLPLRICGKVVVATERDEMPALEELHRSGLANGVRDLSMLGPEALAEIEPHAAGLRALHVPGTAVTDFAAVTRRMAEMATASGARIQVGACVTGIVRAGGEVVVETTTGAFKVRHLVNCAGLQSDRVAHLAGVPPGLHIVPFRGEYHEIAPERSHLVRALIYPVPRPELPFLGAHLTRRVGGGVEAGPNAVWAWKREGYRKADVSATDLLDALRYPGFWRLAARHWRYGMGEWRRSMSGRACLRALRRLVPELRAEDLRPGGAGVRAQAVDRNGALVDDFRLVRSERMIHVLNVPSPAATASLAVARRIVEMMAESFELGRETEWTARGGRA